ncbi:insulinase family protein [Thiohalomonas denitrificans]|uniref:insulinase family protein n=1 Tax=Thiohalomonas denitrificans TaxID=415747 RepID=UPI0026F1800A|nr:insulinase family protein [Thiohalomonas denitrificans]
MSDSASRPQTDPAFEWIRNTPVVSMNVEVQEYRHKATGAPHYHIAANDDQNTFLVAFRTVPRDSSGVAHILEHTALCGSRRYPVRDPFFMMTRRSLNTFMNAFTASDWTAYPFASRNRKDYDNLLSVYLDAAFHPTLDPLDFAQEGHRVEFAEPDNAESELVFKGVVFNEMKGAMSSPVSTLYQTLTEHLFPTITYHYNSGGDPAHIPDLTHEQLKAFHARHYHPSNAIFLTYGEIPAHELQARFQEQALAEFEPLEYEIRVPDEKRYDAPVAASGHYALDGETDTHDRTHIVIGWLLGRSADPKEVLKAHLLAGVLLDNGASPLRKALETTELGSAPSPLCGLQDSPREMIFSAGVEGSNPEHAEAVEQLVLDTLKDVAEKGVDPAMVEAVLHQIELQQREISGDGFPYGLQLIVHALTPAIHGGDPAEALNIDDVLLELREAIQDPEFIRSLAREQLIDNRHRVRLVMEPDPELSNKRAQAEAARLAEIKARMSEREKREVIELAEALNRRQSQQDDPDGLPKVGLEDIPADLPIPEGETGAIEGVPATWFARGTNGLFYQEVVVELPELDRELSDLLPLFCDALAEVGSGGRDYLETQALQAAVTGGIGARATVRGAVDNLNATRGVFVVGGKSLTRNHDHLAGLLQETFRSARFDELSRLRELVAQERLHQEQSVTGSGHALAMVAASSRLSPAAALAHNWNGLAGIKRLKALDDSLDDRAALEGYAKRLSQLRDTLVQAPREFLLIGEGDTRQAIETAVGQHWGGLPASGGNTPFTPPSSPAAPLAHAWTTSTQVNFCARAYPTVAPEHPDAAALLVLAGFLRNNFLHRAIREQGGAYGGGASFDPDAGAFRFFSYRDPRLAETLNDFDRCIDWMVSETHDWRLIEEAILGVISGIDKPGSPAGEAKKAFHAALHGRTPEQRRRVRARVLEVREADLKRVAETYLKPEQANTAVITSSSILAKEPDLGLDVINL